MLDPVQLRTFLAVAEAGGFSEAARRLALGQSTVSQQIRRLEAAVGRELFARDTHRVTLTGDGEVMTGFARSILDQQDTVMRYFSRPELRGRIRLGVSEDLVLGRLPEVLRRFRHSHPMVDLELTVELSAVLHDQLAADKLDLVFAKRGSGESGMRTDPLVWVGAPGLRLDRGEPVPLVVYPEPSITRTRALESLRRNGFSWRIACTCDRLNGLRAATLAGLGVAVFAASVVPDGLGELVDPLPDPGSVVFALTSRRPVTHGPVAALAEVIGSYPWPGTA
ncbi:LysR substrate-binding domain-containing protein [Amycolatopsis sp. CA-230715]|uniref:LysR substrate-binding domain-containing protein n=1 Tax=Amycolatopsis sp. CA-230715 TaxID=2745196 RepID=UPI001C00A3BF|nr:LysR substrate-binding domain-containing protein [Amycolatopsis sp. CA-230715]